jgi:hypothetical protein
MRSRREQARRDRGECEGEQPPGRAHVAEVAQQPEQHAAQAQVVGEREQQAHDRAATRGDDDTGKEKPRRRPAAGAVRHREHQQHRAEGADGRAGIHGEPGRTREHEAERADRRPARHAEYVGIGERIAQQRLHEDARQREHDTGAKGRERARQAQFPDDRAHEGIARRQALPWGIDPRAAEREGSRDGRERRGGQDRDQRRRPHPPHARTVAD